jgi:hypothetical protein
MIVSTSDEQAKAEREKLASLYRATMSGRLSPEQETEMRRLEDKQRGRERSIAL